MTQHAATRQTLARLAYLDTQNHVPAFAHFAVAFAAVVTLWHVRLKTRKELKTLEPEMLQDIGMTRDAAEDEASKPFWRP